MAERFVIPDDLTRAARREGRGDWLAGLPALVARVADGWQVEVGLPFLPGGGTAWVAPARDGAGRPGTQLRASAPAEHDLVIAGLLRRLWLKPPPGHRFRPLSDLCDYWADRYERRSPSERSCLDSRSILSRTSETLPTT